MENRIYVPDLKLHRLFCYSAKNERQDAEKENNSTFLIHLLETTNKIMWATTSKASKTVSFLFFHFPRILGTVSKILSEQ